MALTLRGYGEVTGSGDLSLNYGTVLSGSAPASGDLVIWCARTYDAGDVNTLTAPSLWNEIEKRDATGHTFLSIAKIVGAADIASPATPSVNADDGQYLWLAFKAPGTLRIIDFNSADVAMINTAPANVTVNETDEVGPGVMFSYHGGFGPDATALGEAWSGATADSSFTSIVDSGASEQEHVIRWKIYGAGVAGDNLTASQADRGSNNYQHVSSVWLSETTELGILHSVETGIPTVKPALHSIAWGIANARPTATSLDFDLTNPATAASLTCVRASDGWADNLAGVWTKFASNVPRITDKGMLVEVARSSYCRWSRDLTNAQWVKTNITAAKDQTGVDGVANSASSITATASAATITNTCSIASGARVASMFVKRLVGTGTVELSVNGVANVVSVTVTGSWTRVVSSVITVGNPQFYVRLGTSGDSIAVDFCQTETSFVGAPSSPIETTSATTTTRQQDTVTATPSSVGILGGPTLAIFAQGTPIVPITYGVAQILINWDDTTTSNQVILRRNVTTGAASAFNIIGGTNSGLIGTAIGTVWADGVRGKAALSIATGSQAATKDGGAGTTGSSTSAQVPLSVLRLGNNPANNVSWIGWIERVTVYSVSKTLAELQAMTT